MCFRARMSDKVRGGVPRYRRRRHRRLDQGEERQGRRGRLLPRLGPRALPGRRRELPGLQSAGRQQERGAAQLGVEGKLHHAHLPEVGEAVGRGRLRPARPPRPTAEHLLVRRVQEPGGENKVYGMSRLIKLSLRQVMTQVIFSDSSFTTK